jgi:hypothetical protein
MDASHDLREQPRVRPKLLTELVATIEGFRVHEVETIVVLPENAVTRSRP